MDVNSINAYKHYSAAAKKEQADIHPKNRTMQHTVQTTAPEPGAAVQISDEAKKMHAENNFVLQKLDENSPFFTKELEEFFSLSREERSEKLKTMLPQQEKPSLDPYIQYIFPEGSLGSFLTEQLEGKVDNPSYAAREINNMIKGGVATNPDATSEERAITREAGLKLAEYISQNYFENPEEGKAFLDGVKMFAEKNILMEKGYIVFENSDMKPLKPYNTLSYMPEGHVSESSVLSLYAKKYFGINDNNELLKNFKSVTDAYMKDMKNNPQKINSLKDEIVRDFAAQEKKVQNAVDKAKNYFSGINPGADFMNEISDVLNKLNQPDTVKQASDILKLFE